MNPIFADTSFWFSLAVRADGNHERTAELALQLQEEGALIYLSTLVLAETQRLLLHKLGIDAGQRFLTQLFLQVEQGFVRVLPVTWEHTVQGRKIILKYKDQPLTLTDASSVILMSHYNILRIASYDNHFRILGLTVLP